MITTTRPRENKESVQALVKVMKAKKATEKAKQEAEAVKKAQKAAKIYDLKIGGKLIEYFNRTFFSETSSNRRVAELIANMDNYYVFSYDREFINNCSNKFFVEYLDSLAKKFNIKINISIVKPDDYYSGSGDDMVYYTNPTEFRIYFTI